MPGMPPSQGARRFDLHVHSDFSDGVCPPAEVVRRAAGEGVELLVLTDHEAVGGFAEAEAAGRAFGVRVLCGVEISAREHDNLHILGYGIDPASQALAGRLKDFQARRRRRIAAMLERLALAGLALSEEEALAGVRETPGRPHLADAMIRKGMARTRKEAFDRWLMRGRPGYAPSQGPGVEEAMAAVREAGGWACLAHPGALDDDAWVERLAAAGLEGLEAYYPTHSRESVRRYVELGRKLGLVVTAGSDFHGPGSGRPEVGGIELPEELARPIIERLGGPA